MKTGPRPTPTNLRLLRGNPGRRPLNENEPQPDIAANVPEPPVHVYGHAAEEWRRIAPGLHRLKLLTSHDLKVLEAYCVSYCRWREAEEALARVRSRDPVMLGLMIKAQKDAELIENPLVRISRRSAFEMLRYASEFGFTPAARTRISQPPGSGGDDPFHGLIG
jgi:P27 family predicted phage terminase small subunit